MGRIGKRCCIELEIIPLVKKLKESAQDKEILQ